MTFCHVKYRRNVELVLHYKCGSHLGWLSWQNEACGVCLSMLFRYRNVIEPENLRGLSDITSRATRESFVKVFSLHLSFLALSLLPLLKNSIASQGEFLKFSLSQWPAWRIITQRSKKLYINIKISHNSYESIIGREHNPSIELIE